MKASCSGDRSRDCNFRAQTEQMAKSALKFYKFANHSQTTERRTTRRELNTTRIPSFRRTRSRDHNLRPKKREKVVNFDLVYLGEHQNQ